MPHRCSQPIRTGQIFFFRIVPIEQMYLLLPVLGGEKAEIIT